MLSFKQFLIDGFLDTVKSKPSLLPQNQTPKFNYNSDPGMSLKPSKPFGDTDPGIRQTSPKSFGDTDPGMRLSPGNKPGGINFEGGKKGKKKK